MGDLLFPAYDLPIGGEIWSITGPLGLEARVGVASHSLPDGAAVVFLVEVPENPGPSITNGAECYWPFVCSRLGLNLTDTIKLECYPPHPEQPANQQADPTFYLVEIHGNRNSFGENLPVPIWAPLDTSLASYLLRSRILLSRYLGTVFEHHGTIRQVDLYDGRTHFFLDEAGEYQPIPEGTLHAQHHKT